MIFLVLTNRTKNKILEPNTYITNYPSRKLTRLQFGKNLAAAWNKSASVSNALLGFSATGIIPFNKNVIPDYAFLISEKPGNDVEQRASKNGTPIDSQEINFQVNPSTSFQPTPSSAQKQETNKNDTPVKITPGEVLDMVSPVPSIEKTANVRHRSRRIAEILNSTENIQNLKDKHTKIEASKKEKRKPENKKQKSIKKENKKKKIMRRPVKEDSSDEDSETEIMTLRDSPEIMEWNDNECAGCGKNYEDTESRDDWLKCIICERWSHEGCTKYHNMCDRCGDTMSKK